MSPEEDWTRDAVDSEPKHYQLSYSGPLRLEVILLLSRLKTPPKLINLPASTYEIEYIGLFAWVHFFS